MAALTIHHILQAHPRNEQAEGHLYKFVRVGDDYRFVRLTFYETHASLLQDGETADAAGTIAINQKDWYVMDPGSTTLRVGMDPACFDFLNNHLDRPLRG